MSSENAGFPGVKTLMLGLRGIKHRPAAGKLLPLSAASIWPERRFFTSFKMSSNPASPPLDPPSALPNTDRTDATISLITLFLVFTELFIIQSLILCNKTCHPYAISVTGRPSACKDRPIAGIGKPTDSTIFLKNEVRRIKRRGFCIRAADGKHHTIAQADLRQMVSQHNINNTLFIINIKYGMALA